MFLYDPLKRNGGGSASPNPPRGELRPPSTPCFSKKRPQIALSPLFTPLKPSLNLRSEGEVSPIVWDLEICVCRAC